MSFTSPSKLLITLIKFTYKGVTIGATTDKTDHTFRGVTYYSEPALAVELPERSGGLERETCSITLPTNRPVHLTLRALARDLSKSRTLYPLHVQVTTVTRKGAADEEVNEEFSGLMEKVFRNPDKSRDKVKLEAVPAFASYIEEQTLGLRADPTCSNIYGGELCRAVRRNLLVSDTLEIYPAANHATSIRNLAVIAEFVPNRNRSVTVRVDTAVMPFVTSPVEQVSKKVKDFWVASYLEKDGLRLSIQEWAFDTNVFTLNQIPPLDWDGAPMSLIVDCPRTEDACVIRLGNEKNFRFNGYGIGIPAYNPVLDIGR